MRAEAIAKTPFLREMTEVWSGPITLERVRLADFRAFVAYLTDGTIPAEENVKVFDYFHYPINESYALSWQLESEMRNNFYSDAVYGAHHGLTILTEELWEELVLQRPEQEVLFAGPLPVKRSWSEIQKRLSDIQAFLKDCPMLFLAGGALVSVLFGDPDVKARRSLFTE